MIERAAPRWPGVVGTVLCVLGLADASYLTYEHYTSSTSLACSSHGVVNCLKVTTSTYSKIHGIPVADLGLVFFVVMLVLQLPPMWRAGIPYLRQARVIWAIVGLASVFYLVWAELFRIDAICEYCTGVHILTFATFVVTVFGTLATAPLLIDGDEPELGPIG